MSYTIEYANQFIRSELGITPCWLCGDNNVTEQHWVGGRCVERRTRNWCVFCNLLAVTENEILDKLKSFCGGPYQEHWKRGGKYLDDAAILRWGKNGCSKAVPIEEVLHANHISSVRCYLSVWTKDLSNSTQLAVFVSTTKELDEWVLAVRQFIADHPEDHIYPVIDFPRDGFVRAKPEAKEKSGDDLVILMHRKDYVNAIEKRDGKVFGISCCQDPKQAKVMTRSEALQVASGCFHKLRVVSAAVTDKPYNVIIQFGAGANVAGNYYVSSSSRGFKYTWDARYAKRFPDEAAAKRVLTRFAAYNPQVITLPSGTETV